MLPTLAVLKSLRDKWGAYIVAQLTAPGWGLLLVNAPFTPSPDLVLGDLSIDLEIGNVPETISDSGHFWGRDPADGAYVTLYFSGAGVQTSFSTSDTSRTIYGWCIKETGSSALLASELLPTPVNFVSAEDELRHPEIGFHLPMNLIR